MSSVGSRSRSTSSAEEKQDIQPSALDTTINSGLFPHGQSTQPFNAQSYHSMVSPFMNPPPSPDEPPPPHAPSNGGLPFDEYQLSLLKLLHNSSDSCVNQFVEQKSTQLYRFVIAMFISSLHNNHPLRTGGPMSNNPLANLLSSGKL